MDYFRLIQWDGVNSFKTDESEVNALSKTIILSRNNKLESQPFVSLNPDSELGLHTFGNDAANHVYFDDFGFRLYYLPDTLFPTPLQQ